jgi:hypothetical protein
MREIDLTTLRSAAGIGVAGNFAGHLEQAGEAAFFRNVATASADAPKGIFPWYLPGHEGRLGVFPLSRSEIIIPATSDPLQLQIEPELGALCTVTYGPTKRIATIAVTGVGAFNDCSIRQPDSIKISAKKNWGPAAKGFAARLFPVEDLAPDNGLAHLRIASFLRRGDVVTAYGIDSPARGYSYAGATLTEWLIDRFTAQSGGVDSPLEAVGDQLIDAGCPTTLVIGIGATRYTEFGATHYLDVGDESIVIVYDERSWSVDDIDRAVRSGGEMHLTAASVLCQRVVERNELSRGSTPA